ncbi:hypothetical protein ACQR1Y_24450 [Bradyrhizobium sp. HKCCYLRH3099]|uniref:hypothetical protein n=1 Tax=unclassified Bradyrhizobium TaxID=2631580 RepID=UPI003EBDCEB8
MGFFTRFAGTLSLIRRQEALGVDDRNPIEQVFAKLKHLLRAAEPRTTAAAWRKAGALVDIFSEEECANCLGNSGCVFV